MTGPGRDLFTQYDKPEAQAPQSADPMPDIPYTTYTKDQWQQYLNEKMQEQHSRSNPNALLGIQKAVHALNSYENQAIAPSTGQILGAEAKGVGEIPGQIASGLGQVAEDIYQGHPGRAAGSVVKGFGQMAKGTLGLPAAALIAASGGDVPGADEILHRAEAYGSSAPMAALSLGPIKAGIGVIKAAPSAVASALLGRTLGKLVQAVREGAPEVAKGAAKTAASSLDDVAAGASQAQPEAKAAEQGAAGASPAGSTPQMTPMAGTGGRGFEAEGPPTKPVTKAMEALSKSLGAGGMASLEEIINRNAEINKPSDTGTLTNMPPQFEEGLPAARTSTMPMASKFDIETYLKQLARVIEQGYR